MALAYLKFRDINPVKNYQCGVVAAAFPDCDDDCTQCDVPLDAMGNFVGLLQRYRRLAAARLPAGLKASFAPNYQSYPAWGRIKQSLNLSYPVIAGISPTARPNDPSLSQHAVLITGYDDNYRGTGEKWVVVRDPYPYERDENPYLGAGYSYHKASGKAVLPWRVLRDRLNLSSAVFLEKRSA